MKKLFFLLGSLFIFTGIRAQLTGTAFLSGQSNHSGIKVKFISASQTSVTDSTLTDNAGNYSINISGGVYTIVFSTAGYQPVYYNNNTALVVTNTTVLNSVTLFPGTVVNVSGNVSGNWTSNNIYVVIGDLTIPGGQGLYIQPGTVIKFNGNYSITAQGDLYAVGAPGHPIVFTSNQTTPTEGNWNNITLLSSNSEIEHCVIEYGGEAVRASHCSPSIADNEITRFLYRGIVLDYSSSEVKNNLIHNFNAYDWASGIISSNGNPLIECNTIYDGDARGIGLQGNAQIKNNLIYSISGGTAIDCGWNCTAWVENNVIHDCISGIELGENVSPGPDVLMVNNTIYNCSYAGINFRGMYATGKVIGNIVVNNYWGVTQNSYPNTYPTVVSHNLVWNNSYGNYNVYLTGVGQNVNTNSNGDPVDAYFNVSLDPLFVHTPAYAPTSPCINAGDNAYSANIGCNVNAMCSSMILGIEENIQSLNVTAYPNPFASALIVSSQNHPIEQVRIMDVLGKDCLSQNTKELQVRKITLETKDLPAGIYFVEIRSANGTQQTLRMIKE